MADLVEDTNTTELNMARKIDSEALTLSKMVLYPVILPLAIIGYTFTAVLMKRSSLGRYSSAVYLLAIFTFDKLVIIFFYFIPFLVLVIDGLELNDHICKLLISMAFIGRTAASFTAACLALERVLILNFPTRFPGFATQKTAFILSCSIFLVLLGLSGITMHRREWIEETSLCQSLSEDGQVLSNPPLITLYIVCIMTSVTLLLLLNIMIGVAISRKKNYQSQDPVHSAISAARSRSKQMNKINLISFVMTLTCFAEALPVLGLLFLTVLGLDMQYKHQVYAQTVWYIAPVILATKPYLLTIISPKIREELWKVVTCQPSNSRLRELGVDIKALKPKKTTINTMPDVLP